jgi:hypothetical protein
LEGAQTERATGTLTVKNDGQAFTLYLLFGHLFHASGEGQTGDDAVIGALRFDDGDYAFDAKAKLPSDETVKMSIGELIKAAGDNGAAPAEAKKRDDEPDERRHEPEGKAAKEVKDEEPVPRKGVKHRPTPKHGREPIPVPAGEVIYDSLKTSFVDFPRLITTLESEGYTGYVRLLTEGASGLILFREGAAQECVFDPGATPMRGREALLAFNDEVMHGHGVLDVVGLPAEIVDGLYDLVVAKAVYTELYAAWVDMPALLKFLHDEKLTGSVMVRAEGGTGIVILTDGKATGAYTSESRTIDNEPKIVLDLCADDKAMIEVKRADHSAGRPALDVDEVVGGGSRGHRPASAPDRAVERPAAPAAEPAPPSPPEAPAATTKTMDAFPQRQAEKEPEPPPEPAKREEPAPAASSKQADWDAVVGDLQGLADQALGARSRKVKDLLGSAERSQSGVEQAVAQVSQISLLFVDSALLVKLEQDMRARLQTYL